MLPEYVETEVLNRLGRVIGIGAIFESRIDWFTQYRAMGNNWCATCEGQMKMTRHKDSSNTLCNDLIPLFGVSINRF